ncbi:MAG TPA: Crp/Fnr family transcriptional regulator [Chitinophagaceae bacterium]|jgi:CRP-like cAMP-binding protein|nr:Crp/Fnr family transcriptional regulator [Chitinophagaceae bacterium]
MFGTLIEYLEKQHPLSTGDIEIIHSLFIPKKLLKGEFLLREGDTLKYGAFVCRGFLRSYVIDNKGKEHIIQFAPENWWISDKGAGAEGSKASCFIDAIEDSEILLIDQAGHFKMLEKVAAYSTSFQAGMQKRSQAKDKRIVHSLTADAEERYNDFLQTYPSIAQRVSQNMLASYLGIAPETLSRVRRKSMRKK